jgi:hypothetical protein
VRLFLPVRFLNRYGIPASLPPPRTLVRIINRAPAKPPLRLVYASTLAGVTQFGVRAVIGHGSSKTRIELATQGLDGTLYVLHGRVGSRYIGTFGPAH